MEKCLPAAILVSFLWDIVKDADPDHALNAAYDQDLRDGFPIEP